MVDHSIDWDWPSYIMGSEFLYIMFTSMWNAVAACVTIAVIGVHIKPT